MKNSRHYSVKLLALLSTAGTSLAPVAMLGAASVLLAPGAAMAANECATVGVDPATNLTAPDSYVCAAGTYASGITYTANGPLSVTSTGAITVNTVGVNLTATGTDTVAYTSTAGAVTGTADPVLDIKSVNGAISVLTTGVVGTNANVTYGILAVTSGSGAVSVTNDTGNVNITAATAGVAAIRAASGTGAVNVSTGQLGATVTGKMFGIQTETGGSAATTINADNAVSINAAGTANIDTKATGTGATTINLGGTTGALNGQAGSAIRMNSTTGAQTVNIVTGRALSVTAASTTGVINMTSTGAKTINNAGTINGTASGLAIVATNGTTFALTNTGGVTGRISLTGVTGNTTLTNSGTWTTSGVSALGDGTSVLTNNATGVLTVSGATTFNSLETFSNAGTIALGASGTLTSSSSGTVGTAFAATATTSLITVTSKLGEGSQLTCTGLIAGCISLPNGSISDTVKTKVRVTSTGIGDTGRFFPTEIVLVDATGTGTVGTNAFELDSASSSYVNDPQLGGIIATSGGMFAYALRYNGAKKYSLISVPRTEAFEYASALRQVMAVWNTTTDVVVGRQADLQDGATGGAWARIVVDHSDTSYRPTYTASGNTFAYNASSELDVAALMVGFELGSGDFNGGDFAIGIHGGLVRSKAEVGASTTDDMDGVTAGLYGGWGSGPITFNGAVNVNLLSLDHKVPTMTDTNTNVISAGARGEVGYRIMLGETLYAQPLATASYVHSDIKEVFPGSYQVTFNDVDSVRGAVGLRVGGDSDTSIGKLGMWVTGRLWNEFSDESNVLIHNNTTPASDDFLIADDMSGSFHEVSFGVTLGTDDGGLQGFIAGGAKFADQTDNYNASAGIRWRW